ncbi:MAG: UPF0223 family protein [Ligilactobacillus sp.]|nr:UPF0223 family protein [Ligilactobacillus sp.]
MTDSFAYPLRPEWTTAEIITVSAFYTAVEKAYTQGINQEEFMTKYRAYRQVVPAIMDQKQLDREFLENSGFSIYQATKVAQSNTKKTLRLS